MTTPDYYYVGDLSFTAMDITDALNLNFNLGCVTKYVVRHGRKPGESALKDLRKAQDCLQREIHRLEMIDFKNDRLEQSHDRADRGQDEITSHIATTSSPVMRAE